MKQLDKYDLFKPIINIEGTLDHHLARHGVDFAFSLWFEYWRNDIEIGNSYNMNISIEHAHERI